MKIIREFYESSPFMRTTYEVRGLQASKCGTGKIVEWSNGVKRGLSYFLKCFLEGIQICDNVSNEYHCCDMFRAPVCQFSSIHFKKFLDFRNYLSCWQLL